MRIKCCKCSKEYPARFLKAEGVSVPIVECPYCGFQHAVEFTPLNQSTDSKKHKIKKLNLGGGPDYAQLGGTRILSIDAVTDHSGVDDGNVTNWTKTDEFIIAACIHSGGKDTESSTYRLEWQDDNDGGGYVPLASDSGSPELSFTIANTDWNHGATVATVDQVCDIQGGDTRQEGERIKNQSLSDAIDLPDEYQSELWFGVNSDNSDDGHAYSFQLYSVAEGAAVGICGATLTITAGAQIYYQDVGQGTVAIAGTLKKKTSVSVGQHAMVITGDVSMKLRLSQAVGGYAMPIAGSLSTVVTFRKAVGGYAMTIIGSLRKKIKKSVGGHAMAIAGGVKKKTTKKVGEGAVAMIGSLSTRLGFKQPVGSGIVTIAGNLATQFIQGAAEVDTFIYDLVKDVVKKIVKNIVK